MPLSHSADRRLCYQEHGFQIYSEYFVPLFLGYVLQLTRFGDCRVVDEDVDTAEGIFDLSDHAIYIGAHRNVRLNRKSFSSKCCDLAAYRRSSVRSVEVVDGDVCTSPSQCKRN